MKIIFNCLAFLAILFFGECTNQKKPDFVTRNIHFKTFRSFVMEKEDVIGIKIIKTYPNEKICTSKIINANLYICEDIRRGDTIYVFSVCNNIPWFVKEIPDENFFLLGETMNNNPPDSINILVPKSFRMKEKSNYIFSNITRLED